MRAAWQPDLEMHRLRPSFRPFVQAGLPLVHEWDRRSAARVTAFAGISTTVVDRIRRVDRSEPLRLFSQVDVESFRTVGRRRGPAGLALRPLTPPQADWSLADRGVLHQGRWPRGQQVQEFRQIAVHALAGPSVRFVGRVDDERYQDMLSGAIALLFPGEEDFGMVPVEAQAAGCPVVALAQGGALDTVRDGETGVLFSEPTAAGLAEGISALLARSWDADPIRAWASQFSEARFTREFREFVGPYAR